MLCGGGKKFEVGTLFGKIIFLTLATDCKPRLADGTRQCYHEIIWQKFVFTVGLDWYSNLVYRAPRYTSISISLYRTGTFGSVLPKYHFSS